MFSKSLGTFYIDIFSGINDNKIEVYRWSKKPVYDLIELNSKGEIVSFQEVTLSVEAVAGVKQHRTKVKLDKLRITIDSTKVDKSIFDKDNKTINYKAISDYRVEEQIIPKYYRHSHGLLNYLISKAPKSHMYNTLVLVGVKEPNSKPLYTQKEW